jgi:hypothetical protein
VIVHGQAPSSLTEETVALEFAPRSGGARAWQKLSSTRVGGGGHFRLVARLRRSGAIRVVATAQPQSQATTTTTTATTTIPSATAASQDAGGVSSAPERVTVAAQLRVRPRSLAIYGGGPATVRGRLLPGTGGRHVRLQALRNGHWQTIARGRTSRRGAFAVSFSLAGGGTERLRVEFAGDRGNGPVRASAGSATVYTQSLASWYNDGGNTACGFHAYYGVANVSLPCGTKVNFIYGGHRVTAVVDDRGPYVGGRTWDLNQNTAGALGFGGVGAVWTSQ